MIWINNLCVNNVRISAIIASNIFLYFIIPLLNCYSYVHIIHFNIAPQFLDVFLFFLFTFLLSGLYRSIFKFKGILYFCCCLLFLAFLLFLFWSFHLCLHCSSIFAIWVLNTFIIKISCLFIYATFKPSSDDYFKIRSLLPVGVPSVFLLKVSDDVVAVV